MGEVSKKKLKSQINKNKVMETTSKRISGLIHKHSLDLDDISDIALSIVDIMVSEDLIPDCTDTEKENEFQAQDIIRDELTKLFNPIFWVK